MTTSDGRLLLLSGGIDSTALAALTRPRRALFVDYGQLPARGEFRAALAVAAALQIELDVLRTDCNVIGAGLLAGRPPDEHAPSPEWWPFRNQLLVTLAAAWGIQRGIKTLLLGTVATDGERHRDGTREFITLLDGLVASQEGELRLDAPAIGMTSAELVRASGADRSLLCWSFSCHVAPTPCMRCPGCTKQRAVLNGLSLPNVASNPP